MGNAEVKWEDLSEEQKDALRLEYQKFRASQSRSAPLVLFSEFRQKRLAEMGSA